MACSNTFGIPFAAAELPGEKNRRQGAERKVRRKQARRIEIGVAVDAAETQELRVFEPRNQAENALLLRNCQPRLEPHHVVAGARLVFAPQLTDGKRPAAGAGVDKADRLQGPERERLPAPLRHHLDGQAGLEKPRAFESARRGAVGLAERVVKDAVLLRGGDDYLNCPFTAEEYGAERLTESNETIGAIAS
jgi:hypothetical protein